MAAEAAGPAGAAGSAPSRSRSRGGKTSRPASRGRSTGSRQDRSDDDSQPPDRRGKLRDEIKKFSQTNKLDEKVSSIMLHMHPVDVRRVMNHPFPKEVRSANGFVVSTIRRVEDEAQRAAGYRWDGKSWSDSPRRGWAEQRRPRPLPPFRRSKSQRPASRSRSKSSRLSRRSRSKSRDSSCSRSCGKRRTARRGSPTPQRKAARRSPSPQARAAQTALAQAEQIAVLDKKAAPTTGPAKRAAPVACVRDALACFFNGASVADILLEGSGIIGVPSHLREGLMTDFPHAFKGLPSEHGSELVDALARFTQGLAGNGTGSGSTSPAWKTRSAEVRHELVIELTGRRIIRKALVINGEVFHSEERVF